MKNVKKIFGIIFFNTIFGALFVLLNQLSNNGFLNNFLSNQILPISATILGFNLTGIIFLAGQISTIESKVGCDFENSKREIKDNIYFMGVIFLILIFLLFINPTPTKYGSLDFCFNSLTVGLFFAQFYAVYEIINAVFLFKEPKK